MTRENFVAFLRHRFERRSRRLRFLLLIPLLCFLSGSLLLDFVAQNPLQLDTPSARNYMLHTRYDSFDTSTLRACLLKDHASELLLPVFLVVYWSYHLALVIVLVSAFLLPLTALVYKRRTPRNAYTTLIRVRDEISSYLSSTRTVPPFRLFRLLTGWRLASVLSPVPQGWRKTPEQQWFGAVRLPPHLKSVLAALSRFPDALEDASYQKSLLERFLPSLVVLDEFFWSVALRTDPLLRQHPSTPRVARPTEFELLVRLAEQARPLILESKRLAEKPRSPSLRGKFRAATGALLRAPLFRHAAVISSLAAAAMASGAFFLQIDPKQAFLGWFAVTFGSLTISVGLTSVRMDRVQDGTSQPPPERRAT